MNNPLVQRAQYYLNESDRLNEQLKAQHEYSRLLEAVLEEILTEEEILEVRKGILSKIGTGLVTGACMLGSGCDSKPVEPEKTSQVQPESKPVATAEPVEPEKTSQVQPEGKSGDALNAASKKLGTTMEMKKQQKAMRLKLQIEVARKQKEQAEAEKARRDGKSDPRD